MSGERREAGSCILCLSGQPRLQGPGGEALPLPAKSYLLAAFLALAGPEHVATRVRLAEFLWPDADVDKSHANLRQLLARIRAQERRFGFQLFESDAAVVRLSPRNATIDLLEIEGLLKAPSADAAARLCRAYAGDLLEGSERELDTGGEWIAAHRARLREAVAELLSRFLESGRDADDAALIEAAQRLLDIDIYQEPGYRALMRVYARNGQPFQVRRIFEQCQDRLKADLDVAPTPETQALFQQLVSGTRPVASSDVPPDGSRSGDVSATRRIVVPSGVPRLSILMPSDSEGKADKRSLIAWLLHDVTIGLCCFRSVSVVAPYTSWSLDADNTEQAVERFGIDYFVLTDLVREGQEGFLYVKLVNARTRLIQWAERFAFGPQKLAMCYRDLSLRIAVSLADAVERIELDRLQAGQDATAYRWYLSGQRDLRDLNLPSIRKARRAFRHAQASCPDFAPGYSGLARTFQLEYLLLARGDRDPLTESIALAERAVAIDPDDLRGYHELGASSLYARSFEQSIECFTEAERRSPQHADLLADFGDALTHYGEPELGLKKLDEAIALNPQTPDHYHWYAAGMNYQMERYEEAIATVAKMRDETCALRLLAASNAHLGRRREARRCVRKAMETYPDFTIERWLAVVPNKRPEDTQRYADGLRMAGFQ